MRIKSILITLLAIANLRANAAQILIPMDDTQANHLKAYGIAYWVLQSGIEINWMLNYRGGSFMFIQNPKFESELKLRGVSYNVISEGQANQIVSEILDPQVNQDVVKLEKVPKICVYSPKDKRPWDDAVTLALTYAEIPYDVIYDEEIIQGKLALYDWMHLHHEDFTGQYGKFYNMYRNATWYQEQQRSMESMAKQLGFAKVSQMKLAVAKRIKEFVAGGGFLFTMCSGTDTYDIALSAEGLDICESMYDGDGTSSNYNDHLDFSKTFAFRDYTLSVNPLEYRFSNIDVTTTRRVPRDEDVFTLFDFSAKWDPVPTMLCQDHMQVIKGFMGQTTAFNKAYIKPDVIIMGENKAANEAKYIHGDFGKGTWTFYGGHDPEDYQHMVGDPPTDLNLHPNSPGYRLILNNVLFPAAKKKKQKT
ncbi:MAG: asparagine synthetase B [Bacteroidetes bacterium]|nr:asparagine synthetase B [Bacteroidota bacterium]MBX7238017.1 asparagine synthetase B [Bacteroidia bacterium]MCC7515298.1 asparagine synthetase B [Bacteroidia bacterium]HMU78045.1 asparagine synthetase B [Bacteroidia bacterium]HMW08822.1 asparagine synthetase B [Bacteroidia bacterium]